MPTLVEIQHVALDAGGYDASGTYWGLGNPLFMITHLGNYERYEHRRYPSYQFAVQALSENDFLVVNSRPDAEAVIDYYTEALLWCGYRESSEGLEVTDLRHSLFDITSEDMEDIRKDITEFLERIGPTSLSEELLGRDFYFTRSGHGTGFWDKELGDEGIRLSRISESFGSQTAMEVNGNIIIENG